VAFESVSTRILVIHLEALGAVLRSTSLLPAIRRKYPRAHITWVTRAPAEALLQNLSAIDRVLTLSADDLVRLSALEFDYAFVIDKSLLASGVLQQARLVREVRGFKTDPKGAVVPANPEAMELWRLGLSDTQKFFVNQKSEQQLVHEALALGPYQRDEYSVTLSATEMALAQSRRSQWSPGGRLIIGINTGSSANLPHKKLTVDGHRRLIAQLRSHPVLRDLPVVLLGGREDSERNLAIGQGLSVLQSPTQLGLRDGLSSMAACDLVFSGDSLGLHMAIGLRKWAVAWFGPTCAQEIDLYDRGAKVLTRAACSPCWRRDCHKPIMCYDQVDFNEVASALAQGFRWLTSSFKPHSPETFFSPSP